MKYLLFAFDNYYPGGVDLAAVSDDIQKLIDIAPSFTEDNVEIFEMVKDVGLVSRWCNDGRQSDDVTVRLV